MDNELKSAREKYFEVVGKKPYHGWDIETLEAKIAEVQVESFEAIDEVEEPKKKPVQSISRSTEPKFHYFVELREYDHVLADQFVDFVKLFPNKKLKTNGYTIDTKAKTIVQGDILIFKDA